MYKVFLNERVIKIGPPVNITLNKPIVNFDESASVDDVRKWFNLFKDNRLKEIYLSHPDPGLFFVQFQSAFLRLPAAGGVILSGNDILFIYRRGKWDLPKGKMEEGEAPHITALREVEEETGLNGHRIIKQLPSTFHIYQSPYPQTKGKWVFKETYWFEMKYAGTQQGTPQVEEDISEVRWINKNNLDSVLLNTYDNLKQIIYLYKP